MVLYGKVYKLEKQENYEQFADSFGLSEEKKALLIAYKGNQKFEKDGDSYKQILYINDVERSVTFKSGEEFESVLRSENVKNVITVDGDTFTQVIKFPEGGIIITVKKEFSGNKMVETITNNKWDGAAKRYYTAE